MVKEKIIDNKVVLIFLSKDLTYLV